jgi:citrate synthase
MAAPAVVDPRPDHLTRRRLIAPRRADVHAELGPDVHRGLVGVVADTTTISDVDPATRTLLYRGYPVTELARRRGFLDVAHLLWTGELPTETQAADLAGRERALRGIDRRLESLVHAMPETCHPTDVLRTAVSWIGAEDPTGDTPDDEREKAVRLVAALPTVVALDLRRRRGLDPVRPDPALGYAANLLRMCFGEVPEPEVVRAFEIAMVLYAEHSFNASTFAARVVTSTLSDLHSAVGAGIGALKGPLHGGANEAVMAMITDIGGPDDVEPWLERMLAERRTIMGFGHRVYKRGDSRVPILREELVRVAGLRAGGELIATYHVLVSAMLRERGLHPNLDCVAGPLFHLVGFGREFFTALFALSRVVGWTAHVMEQRAANSLIRPLARYVGPAHREV